MKTLFAICLLLGQIFTAVNSANADLLCVKKKVAVKKGIVDLSSAVRSTRATSCPRGYALVKDLNTIKDPQLVAFATANQLGTVTTFGGNGTTTTSVELDQTGGDTSYYRFTFNGNFSALTSTDSDANRAKLTVLSSGITYDWPGTAVSVNAASSTQIRVSVAIWKTDQIATLDYQRGVHVAVLIGQ